MHPHILDELIEKLKLESQLKAFAQRHDDARVAFRFGKATVATDREFENAIVAYYQHHERYTNGKNISREEALYEAEQILDGQFRNKHGIEGAMREGKEGSRDGGMVYIFNILAEAKKEKHRRIYIRSVIRSYFSLSDFDDAEDCLSALEQKLSIFWPKLPKRIRIEMALKISEVLEKTAQIDDYLLNMGGTRRR